MNATISDLRRRTGEIMDAVDRGETVHVLCRGKERAVIIPARQKPKKRVRMEDHPFVGMWADDKEKEDVAAYVRKLRQDRYREI